MTNQKTMLEVVLDRAQHLSEEEMESELALLSLEELRQLGQDLLKDCEVFKDQIKMKF